MKAPNPDALLPPLPRDRHLVRLSALFLTMVAGPGLNRKGRRDPDLLIRELTILLLVVFQPEPLSMGELGSRLDIPGASISRSLSRLEKLRFVRRVKRLGTRSTKDIVRTLEGMKYVERIRDIMTNLGGP
jgi:DNA-binding MarR family transcriptional regulator